MKMWRLLIVVILCIPMITKAQQKTKERKGEFYFSWGYNKEWYTRSTVKVNQPSLNNNYSIKNVASHDHPGWDEGLFTAPISIPRPSPATRAIPFRARARR